MTVPVLFITQNDVDMLNAQFQPAVPLTLQAVAGLVAYFQPKADAKAELLRVSKSELGNLENYRALLVASNIAVDDALVVAVDGAITAIGALVTALTPEA